VEDIDKEEEPRRSGLKLSDPILLGPEETADFAPTSDKERNDSEEIVREFTWDRYPKGPRFEPSSLNHSIPAILLPDQVDDLNDVLFAICKDLAGKARAKRPLTKKDIPHLKEEWKTSCQDILSGVLETLLH
jgi:hypothetical protein